MDEPDITMEEYVQLETQKALKNGKVNKWETTTHGKIWCDEDVHYLRFFETEFPAIVYDDALATKSNFSFEPTVSPQHFDKVNLKNETLFSKYDEKDNDDDKINIKQSSGDISFEPLPNIADTAYPTSMDMEY
nr:hypothetical protein [Tanacetum cinerariifolium]